MAKISYAHAGDRAVVAFTGELDWDAVPGGNDPRPRRGAPRYPCPSGANDARE